MKHQYKDYILDLLQPHGPITVKSLFGGFGIYYNNLIIGIIVDSQLYFKVDDQTRHFYEALGSEPFIYVGKSKTVAMRYMVVPDSILEDSEILPEWIEQAYDVTVRHQKTKKPKKPKKRTQLMR